MMNDNAARPCPVSVDDIAAELLAAMWRATLDLRDAAIALRDDPTGAAAVEAFDLATAVMNRPLEEWLRRIGNVSESRGLEEPFYSDDLVTLYRGDSLTMLQQLESETIGAIVTDPPYSSGGAFRGDRANANTSTKYQKTGTIKEYYEFAGDNRDQRSFLAWCSLWLADAYRAAVPGAPIVIFSDWRQLPTMTDAMQAGGWVWRGVVPWDKTGMCRPNLGRFASQCEYALWGSKGAMKQEPGSECIPGLISQQVERNKPHMTAKPVEVLQFLLRIVRAQGIDAPVLDPFAGGGSTGVAAAAMGMRCLLFEQVEGYCQTIADRLRCVKRSKTTGDVQHSLFGSR